MRKHLCLGALGALGALAGTCLVPSGAGATTLPRPVLGTFANGRITAEPTKTPGDNQAGYLQDLVNPNKVNVIFAAEKVATITCTDRVTTNELDLDIVNGTTPSGDYTGAGVVLNSACTGTSASYTAIPIVDSGNDGTQLTVSPGDLIGIEIIINKTHEEVTVVDETTGGRSGIRGGGFVPVSAQASVEAGYYGVNTGFPKSTQHEFGVEINGYGLSAQRAESFDMVDLSGTVEMAASPLMDRGERFNVHYYQNH